MCIELQIEKGKLHGSIDVGLSVMAIKKKAMCIDLDAEENIYHLKVKHGANEETFPTGPRSELGLDPLDYFNYPHTHADGKMTLE